MAEGSGDSGPVSAGELTRSRKVLNAEGVFAQARQLKSAPENISQLSQHAQHMLGRKDVEVSKLRPFFWSLVETYVDRFDQLPFDVNKALFSHLESVDYPEQEVLALIEQLVGREKRDKVEAGLQRC